jgi:hypothetical protein
MTLKVTFVRHRERRDRIYVTRSDGTSTSWDFPSYGDRLPHDLCHLVVEDGLGMVGGFWGLVDTGVDVELIDNQATLVRHGRPLAQRPGFDVTDLMRAEMAVAYLSGFGDVGAPLGAESPEEMSMVEIVSIRRHLDDLGRQWQALEHGGSITLDYGEAGERRSHQVGGPPAIRSSVDSVKPRRP